MARKELTVDPRIGNQRVGLMISRGQVHHAGHVEVMAQMIVDNSVNVMGYGSSQKSGILGNPLTFDQKRRALQGLWGGAFKLISLQDIGATDRNTDWADYVMDRIRTNQLPEPTDYYAGSRHDARWYENHFAPITGEPDHVRGRFQVWERDGKRIHILDRKANSDISSSEVRALIEQRDPSWKNFVPAKLWDFYEWEYPGHLRAALEISAQDLPDAESYPVGTKLIRTHEDDEEEVLILRDDGKWRPRTAAEFEKSMGD